MAKAMNIKNATIGIVCVCALVSLRNPYANANDMITLFSIQRQISMH